MSNSALVEYIRWSPNKTSPRRGVIRKITIHHIAGDITLITLGNIFAPVARQASSNYGVDSDGGIGMYVREADRAWTSSSAKNDNQAITIEVANNKIGGNWSVSDKALEATIELCVDIIKRNPYITEIEYNGKPSGTLTRHDMFANVNCPGPYLKSKFPYIEREVNKRLKGKTITVRPVNNNLRYGSVGAEVQQLQKDLKRLGYKITVGGAYGNETMAAVKYFQSKHKGVRRSGEVDETTSKMIKEDLDAMILRRGSIGAKVTKLQEDLKYLGYDVTVRGGFGPELEKAVLKFQSRHSGVKRNGIVDEITLRMIEEDLKAVRFFEDKK